MKKNQIIETAFCGFLPILFFNMNSETVKIKQQSQLV